MNPAPPVTRMRLSYRPCRGGASTLVKIACEGGIFCRELLGNRDGREDFGEGGHHLVHLAIPEIGIEGQGKGAVADRFGYREFTGAMPALLDEPAVEVHGGIIDIGPNAATSERFDDAIAPMLNPNRVEVAGMHTVRARAGKSDAGNPAQAGLIAL